MFGFFDGIGAENGVEEQVDGDVVDLLQVPLEFFAVAAVGVLENGEFAFPVAPNDRESVFQRQGLETDGVQLVDAFLGQVAALPGVDQIALHQVVAFGIGVENLGAVNPNLKQARHRAFADLVDFLQLGNSLGQILANGGLLRGGA